MNSFVFGDNNGMEQDQQLNSIKQTYQRSLQRLRKAFIALSIFVIIIAAIFIVRYFKTFQERQDGIFYRNQILSYKLDPFWQMTSAQIQSETKNRINIIKDGEHKISRAQLGRMGWTMLHMITGTFPEFIDTTLKQKFNTFLILFGQMYPCKLCANHFMQLIAKFGPFKGNTKKELMIYMCQLHNSVNQRLKKPQHDCKGVVEEWNTCGCSGK